MSDKFVMLSNIIYNVHGINNVTQQNENSQIIKFLLLFVSLRCVKKSSTFLRLLDRILIYQITKFCTKRGYRMQMRIC